MVLLVVAVVAAKNEPPAVEPSRLRLKFSRFDTDRIDVAPNFSSWE